MASLTIRDIPDEVMDRLRRAAEKERRSVNAQAIVWLEERAREWRSPEERDAVFERIRRLYEESPKGSDSTELIRRMRDGAIIDP